MPIPVHDQTWLFMDKPNNLMYINALLWMRSTPDFADLVEVIEERVVGKHPVMGCRAVQDGGAWFWEPDPDFDISRHVTQRRMPKGSTKADVQDHLSTCFGTPFPSGRPLWSMELLTGIGDGHESVLFIRIHHGITDGIRSTQLLLNMCDHDAGEHSVARVGDRHAPAGPLDLFEFVGRHVVHDAGDLARATSPVGAPDAMKQLTRLPHAVSETARRVIRRPGTIRQVPGEVVEGLASFTAEDNTFVNTSRAVFRLVFEPRSPKLAWSGTPGLEKKVGWVDDIPLDEVKALAHDRHATVNDVLMSSVSRALTTYLAEEGTPVTGGALNWLVPISLAPLDAELPPDLGNHFSLVMFRMPVGINDPIDALRATRSMMNRTKHSLEPHVAYTILQTLALGPRMLSAGVRNYLADKCVGQLTNVPGPQSPLNLAGARVESVLGWVPLSGDQTLGLCIFTYAGRIGIGISADAALVRDPQRIADLVAESLDDLTNGSLAGRY